MHEAKPRRTKRVETYLAFILTIGYNESMDTSKAASALGRRSAEVRQKKWGKREFVKRLREWGKLGGRPKGSRAKAKKGGKA